MYVKNESRPCLSVVVSTYNSEEFIQGRLENLIEQTVFTDSEVIIVNSGSEQNEERIIKEYQKYFSNIHYIVTPERETIYKAWNRAIGIARGKYITNANTDDRLRFDALEVLSNALDSNPHIAMVYADQYITSKANSSYESSIYNERFHRRSYSHVRLFSYYLPGPQSMWRASLHFNDGIWFDDQYEVVGDYDFACRVAERYRLLFVPDVLGVYYRAVEKSNKEFQDIERTDKETYDIQQKYAHRYIATLSYSEFIRLYLIVRIRTTLPLKMYALLQRYKNPLEKERYKIGRSFWFWIGSLMEEKRGNIKKAKDLCRKCIDVAYTELIRRQYQHLMELY